jgi:methyl coenzyme M reductase beta subunit
VLIGLGNYALYFPFKVYDVRMMTKRLETIKPKAVFYSLNSVRAIRRFDAFTEGVFDIESKYVYGVDYRGPKDSLFVLQLVHQFGRLGENGPVMEASIKAAIEERRINLLSAADGFNMYKINDPLIVSEFVRDGILHPDYAQGTELTQQPNFFKIH